MDEVIVKAEELYRIIKLKQKEIDNPALVIGILNELEFFIENANECS